VQTLSVIGLLFPFLKIITDDGYMEALTAEYPLIGQARTRSNMSGYATYQALGNILHSAGKSRAS
jgi:hypothetical protein